MKNQQKIRLIITRNELFDTNLRCIVSEFEITDKGGEPGDIYYSIKLREYRDYSPRTVSIITSQGDGTQQQTAGRSGRGGATGRDAGPPCRCYRDC